MKISFCDINAGVVIALQKAFGPEGFEYFVTDVLSLKADACVSPANSFGKMTSGVDKRYVEGFGKQVETELKVAIRVHANGELPIGKALVVPVLHPNYKYMIAAPTMRTHRNIEGTDNVYHAFLAVLRTAKAAGIESIVATGMGTLAGGLDPVIAAKQMFDAYTAFTSAQ